MPEEPGAIRAAVFREAGMFDESLATHEDWDLWIRLSQVCSLHHIKKVTSEYLRRQGADESMTSNPQSNFDQTRKAIYAKYRPLVAHRPDRRSVLVGRRLRTALHGG